MRAGYPVVLMFVLTLLGFTGSGFAASLRAVQSGTAILGSGNNSITVAISPVDTTRSFLVFGVNGNSSNPIDFQTSGQITSSTQLTFARMGTGPSLNIAWYVAEFTSGVTVYRGNVSTQGLTTINVPFVSSPGVDLTKSFPIVSYRKEGTSFNADDFIRAKITSSTNLQLTQGLASPNVSIVEWQVVEYQDAAVQTGDLSFSTAQTTRTANIGSVNTAKTWLFYTYETGTNGTISNIGQRLIRGLFNSSTQLSFQRSNSGQSLTLTWYVIQFTDATIVQSGNAAFATADTQKDATLTQVFSATCPVAGGGGHYLRGGMSPYSADDNPGVAWFTSSLTSDTNLRMNRGFTGSSIADIGWFVPEFEPPSPLPSLSLTLSGPALTNAPTEVYTIDYSVPGSGLITNTVVTLPLPAGIGYVSSTGGGTFVPPNVVWNLGALPGGSTGSLTVTVSFSADGTFDFTAADSWNVCVTPFTGSSNTISTIHYTIALLRYGGVTSCNPQSPPNSSIFPLTAARDMEVPNYTSGAAFPHETSDLGPTPCLIFYQLQGNSGNTLNVTKGSGKIVITF